MTDQVFKKVHEDKSETVIKMVKPAYRKEDGTYHEREDEVTSIFISSSYGCPYKCTFCHLTENNVRFKKLGWMEIVKNVLEAVYECPFVGTDEQFKLCFMGMGDPTVDTSKTYFVITELLRNLDVKEIDISSVKYTSTDVTIFSNMMELHKVPIRLFYSIMTDDDGARSLIVGGKPAPVVDSLVALDSYTGDVKIHYTPVKGLNDSFLDVLGITKAIKTCIRKPVQVRMLELNPAGGSVYERPSQEHLSKLYQLFVKNGVDIKWQVSKGYPEKAACGMFHREV